MARQLLFWRILAVLSAGVIFFLSTGQFNSSWTLRVLSEILKFLGLSLTPPHLELLNEVIRKLAHLTEYAVFALILYRCFREAYRPGWQLRPALWALAAAAVYSLTDEFHQSFVPERTASWVDCGIDTSGAALGMLGLFAKQRVWPMSDDATPQGGDA